MTTTLRIATSNAHSWAFAARHSKSNFVTRFVELNTLYSRTNFVGLPFIVGIIVVEEVEILEMVRPYAQCSSTGGLSIITWAT